jgi:hypothetical protein
MSRSRWSPGVVQHPWGLLALDYGLRKKAKKMKRKDEIQTARKAH